MRSGGLQAEQPPSEGSERQREDETNDARSEQKTAGEAPALMPERGFVDAGECGCGGSAHQRISHAVVEPVERQVGERIADPGAGSGQQVVAPNHAGQANAKQGLQSKEGEATAEDTSGQAPGALTRTAFLFPEPPKPAATAFDQAVLPPDHGLRALRGRMTDG